jgi:hypothetical protein
MALASKIPALLPSDDIQDPKKGWTSTIAFRKFRSKHNELSKLNWTSILGSHYIGKQNATINAGEKLTIVGQPLPFKGHMMPLTKEEMIDWLPSYEYSIRNAILLLCSGNLELYLKRSIRFHLITQGYEDPSKQFKLTSVGEALGAPVLRKSTIHLQLKYIETLLNVDFSKHLNVWEKAYKERCNLAHQAGVVSHADDEDIEYYGENIQTDWIALRQLLDSTNQIVGIIDQKVASVELRMLELEFELGLLKKAKKLPKKGDLWTYTHKSLGCDNPAREEKERIERILYPK